MKRRESLLRLKRFRVDELKRRLVTLDEMKADLEKKLSDLDDSVTR
jgi:flagellar protein FliJ